MKITIFIIAAFALPQLLFSQLNKSQPFERTEAANNHYSANIQVVNSKKAVSKKDIYIYVCQFFSGSADGINQALVHHYLGMGNRFWDFQTSWKNKYKNYDEGDLRPAFFGSTSFAVSLTDGYHLTRMADRAFSLGSLAFALGEKQTFKSVLKKIIISSVVNRAGFLLFFDVIYPGNRAKKNN